MCGMGGVYMCEGACSVGKWTVTDSEGRWSVEWRWLNHQHTSARWQWRHTEVTSQPYSNAQLISRQRLLRKCTLYKKLLYCQRGESKEHRLTFDGRFLWSDVDERGRFAWLLRRWLGGHGRDVQLDFPRSCQYRRGLNTLLLCACRNSHGFSYDQSCVPSCATNMQVTLAGRVQAAHSHANNAVV